MRGILAGLVALACVVVIAAGGLWLWQQYQVASASAATVQAARDGQFEAAKCGGFIEILQRDAAKPGSVSAAEKQAAIDGRIACLDHGIN